MIQRRHQGAGLWFVVSDYPTSLDPIEWSVHYPPVPFRMGSRKVLGAGVAALIMATSAMAQVAASPSSGPRFRPPVVVIPPELQATEPQLVLTDRGTVLVAAQYQRSDCQTGAPRLAGSRACVWRSTDDGRTFTRSGGGQNTGADVHFARLPSGTLLYTTLTQPEPGTFTSGVGGATILRSTDDGKTWTSTILNGLSPAVDRPFLTVLGRRTVLLTYTAWPGNLFASLSTDDGQTFEPARPMTLVPEQLEFTRPGGPAVDKLRGEVVQPYYAGTSDDPAVNQDSNSGLLDLKVTRSSDGGLTWTQELVAARVRPILGMASVAADDRGGEYLVWSARDDTGRVGAYFSRNLAPGSPWSPPVRLGPPDQTGSWAWTVARGNGGVAVAYVGSDYPDAGSESRPWTMRVAVSQDAGTSWTTQNASGHTVYTGAQNQALDVFYDMFGFIVDDEGLLHLAYPRRVTVDGAELNEIEYTQQTAGQPLGGRGQPSQTP